MPAARHVSDALPILLWLGATAAPGQLQAQQQEPLDGPAPAEQTDPWHLQLDSLELDFDLEYDERRVRERARFPHYTYINRDLRLEEAVRFGLRGDVVDPQLLEWTADLRVGLEQARFYEQRLASDGTDSDQASLLDFDLNLQALRSKPVSVSAYARRFDGRIPRPFLPSLHEKQTEAGAALLIGARPLTMELGYNWTNIDRIGNVREIDDESQDLGRFYVDTHWEQDQHTFTLRYEHEDEKLDYQGSAFGFDTRRDQLWMEHALRFGEAGRHRWDTFLRYNEESGDLARDEFNVNTRLSLQHTEDFKTIYRYGFYRYQQEGIEVDQHRLDLSAEARLPGDLRVTSNLFGSYESVHQDVDTSQVGGSVDLAWQRRTSSGELSANLNLGYDYEETHGDGGRRFVRNEALRLGLATRAYLVRAQVIPESIFVHSLDYARVYLPGVDYLQIAVGDVVYFERLLGSRILDGEVVYVDYHYRVPAGAEISGWRTDFLLEHRFDSGWTPYYSFEARFLDGAATTGVTPPSFNNLDRQRLGLRLDRATWGASVEGEYYDDEVEPYHAVHVLGRAQLLERLEHTLDVHSELSRYWFRGDLDHRQVWWFDMELQDHWQLDSRWSMNTKLGYRWEDDSLDGTTNGVDAEWLLRYTRDYLAVELALEYDLLSIAGDRDDGYSVFLRVRRDLSHLLPAPAGRL